MLEGLLVQLHVLAEQNLGLRRPLVSLDATWEELDGLVDLLLQFGVHVGNLSVRGDAECVQLLFDERPDALDDLQVVLCCDDGGLGERPSDARNAGQRAAVLTGPRDDRGAFGVLKGCCACVGELRSIGHFKAGGTLLDLGLQRGGRGLAEHLEVDGLGTRLHALEFRLLLGFLGRRLGLLLGSGFFFGLLVSLGLCLLLSGGSGSGFLGGLLFSSLGLLGFSLRLLLCLGFLGSFFFSSLGFLGFGLRFLLRSGFFLGSFFFSLLGGFRLFGRLGFGFRLGLGFLSGLQGLFVGLRLSTDDVLRLLDPLVSTDASLVVLDGIVDLVLGRSIEVGELCVREDAERVQLFFAVGADALDDLEVVSVLLGGLADAFEVKGFLSLLDARHRVLLLRFSLVVVGHDGDVPEEVHAGLAQLDASGVGAALERWEFAVVELEVDDHLTVFAHRQNSRSFHAEGRLVHVEATVVAVVVVIDHLHGDLAHVSNGDFFDG